MLKQHQLFRHKPAEFQYGDCGRTAIACVLDMPVMSVPHFIGEFEARQHAQQLGAEHPRFREFMDKGDISTYSWERETESWLNRHGYTLLSIMFGAMDTDGPEGLLNFMEVRNPGLYYMLIGESVRGTNHVVVARGGEMVWDPHPDGGFIIKPHEGYYTAEFLLPLSMKQG